MLYLEAKIAIHLCIRNAPEEQPSEQMWGNAPGIHWNLGSVLRVAYDPRQHPWVRVQALARKLRRQEAATVFPDEVRPLAD
jgi:hypothetical protein